MKETLENLWEKYLLGECARLVTEEERNLTKKAAELHEKANALLSKEQEIAVEQYTSALCEAQALFVKKAFFKGCRFAVAFLLETKGLEK